MGTHGAALSEWEWWVFGTGFFIGLVIGLCLGVVAVIVGDPKE